MLSRRLAASTLNHLPSSTSLSSRAPLISISSSSFRSQLSPQKSILTPLIRRSLSDAVRSSIDQCVESKPVVLFMKGTPDIPQCGFSRASVQILSLQGVDPGKFAAFNVLEDENLRQGLKEYSDWPTIPQLYVNKEFVGGCDILMSMHQNGELGKMFEEKGVLVEDKNEDATTQKDQA